MRPVVDVKLTNGLIPVVLQLALFENVYIWVIGTFLHFFKDIRNANDHKSTVVLVLTEKGKNERYFFTWKFEVFLFGVWKLNFKCRRCWTSGSHKLSLFTEQFEGIFYFSRSLAFFFNSQTLPRTRWRKNTLVEQTFFFHATRSNVMNQSINICLASFTFQICSTWLELNK